jgi:hypothetical protein
MSPHDPLATIAIEWSANYVKLDIDRWPQLKRYVERVGAPGCHRGVRGRKTAGIASSTEVDRLAEVVGLGTPGSALLDLIGKYRAKGHDVCIPPAIRVDGAAPDRECRVSASGLA